MTTETALCAPIRRSFSSGDPGVRGAAATSERSIGLPGSCFPSKQILAEGETFAERAEQDKTHKGGGGPRIHLQS